MGRNNKRKRNPLKPSESGDTVDVKRLKESEESLFLDELHKDEAKLLSDLLVGQKLVFVEGTVGCGKTSLVKRVADELNLPVVSLQLSDQIDAKTLIGCYQCTEVPGEFVWEPSVFSKAVTKKCLILLEDVDSATTELVSSLYLMNKSWNAPLHSDGSMTPFHQDARIVATVRSENNHSDSAELIRSNPMRVTLKPFTNDELREIVVHKFPSLLSVSEKLLEIFFELSQLMSADSIIDRDLNANDLIRACRRLSSLSNLNDNKQIFIELSDIYVLSISNLLKRSRLAAALGKHLSIPEQQADTLLCKRDPEVISHPQYAKFGRIKIPLKKGILVDTLASKHFGFTPDAKRLMERIAVCVQQNTSEAVLLTGETGVGKTSIVQMMALYTNMTLDVVNLSQDSDSTDLIGGYKPIGTLELLTPLTETVEELLKASFNTEKNARFLSHFTNLLNEERFTEYLNLVEGTSKKAIENKCGDQLAWADVLVRCQRLLKSLNSRKSALPFAYVEGIVSKAAKNGHWLLVDEINLASSECLDAIVHVFDGNIERHPDFRLFACMNPATDTGKKKLPIGIRTRFTEFFVHEPTDKEQLTIIVRNYLPTIEALHLGRLLNYYKEVLTAFPRKFSLRNLCRALAFAGENLYGNSYRSLFEGVSLSFGSDLDNDGMVKFDKILLKHFENVPTGVARAPVDQKKILVEGSYVEVGDNLRKNDPHYVYTKSIKYNLSRLSRAVGGRFPILLEGETSAGKTSMILDLALVTGNIVHRINNHEHTDIQEYIGCYAPDENGKLTFVEGVLLQAVRQGHWVILDELNLAPVEVLEALNRLLDDNRELFVAERNLVVKAHPRFRLFATQNPVGSYAGRKRLSRAFLNRFVLLRFDHPPFEELSEIVCARCGIANTHAVAMIKVLTELKRCRSNTGLFNASDGLMTLRDLFRWANRLSQSSSGEWRQVLADQGYFLLASRCRNPNDAAEVVRVIEQVLKVKIDIEKLFAIDSPYLPDLIGKQLIESTGHVVSTFGMRRMLVLSAEAWRCKEPILMVGETGCGKTTAAQLLSEGKLLSINCHERTETSDLLGSIRPKADGSFFWQDGVVVQAMKNGSKLLIDEISLASDSVLERLNPLLESSRTVLLTDAGADAEVVVAHTDFQVVATMNPGTDHGKKELSKALRNRFSEIWCSCDHPVEDIKKIIAGRISTLGHEINEEITNVINAIVEFFVTFTEEYSNIFRTVFSIRDIIAAADLFLACMRIAHFSTHEAFVNSLTGVVVDSIGVLPARTSYNALKLKKKCHKMILMIAKKHNLITRVQLDCPETLNSSYFGPFPIELGKLPIENVKHYSFSTPTTQQNALRVARALLLEKPIMLEGSPGAGKSSLIVALAKVTGHPLVRLNLSDQTDLSDLFGHDVPVSKSDGSITFEWQDGPILKAIKEGSWILLDEMNLSSQSVLEGLNSCFDFRQELFIAELNKTFIINSDQCRFFACQNPQTQGGNRRALPKSFLNRFTSIYIEPFGPQDFSLILNQELPDSRLIIEKMIRFNREMQALVKQECPGGSEFEFNMRDLLRWANFIHEFQDFSVGAEILYINRLPIASLQQQARQCFGKIFGADVLIPNSTLFFDDAKGICFGNQKYNLLVKNLPALPVRSLLLLSSQSTLLQQLCVCMRLNWIVLLNGPRLTGKASLVEALTLLSQSSLKRMKLNKETDASELLGTYEQVLDYKIIEDCYDEFFEILSNEKVSTLPAVESRKILKDLEAMEKTDVHRLRCKVIQVAAIVQNQVHKKLNKIANKLSKVYLRFEWRSSIFVDAYRNGDWLLIEDVNCCSAAVLDRLNCCLESGGKLVLPEQIDGNIEEIEPHANFRVFFTMDPKNGTLSRAMKNRCVEFCVNEGNSWYGDLDSALNVMLSKESLMCSTFDGEWKNEMTLENIKNVLRTAARTNVTTEERYAEINNVLDISPSIDELVSDKVVFHALTAKNNIDRNPPLLLSSKRQLRLPFVEHPLYKSQNGVVPNVLHSELLIQEFHRIAETCASEDTENAAEYDLGILILALMASSPECLSKNSIFCNTFLSIEKEVKKELIDIVMDFVKEKDVSRNSTPWDLRIFDVSMCNYVSHESIDKRLLQLLTVWLKHEANLMQSRMDETSPFALSIAFQEGTIGTMELQCPAYGSLSFICKSLIAAVEQLKLSNSEESRNILMKSFDFIFGTAVFFDLAVNSNSTVHPLLLLRQGLQDLEIDLIKSNEHPIWQQIYASLKADKNCDIEMDKFLRIIGTSSVSQTTEYIDSLNTVCEVRPLAYEKEYLKLKDLVLEIQETFVITKHRAQPSQLSLDLLVKGLQNLLKTYVFAEHHRYDNSFVIHFPETALQHFEIMNRFEHQNKHTKEMVNFLTIMNSNAATFYISPLLKTAHLTSVEILLDVIIDFWKGFNFSSTSFAAISLNTLSSASDKISQYQSFIWIARSIVQKCNDAFRNQIVDEISDFMGGASDNLTFFYRCKEVFKSLIPAKGIVDPGLMDVVNLSVNESRQRALELFSNCSKLFPAKDSAHPFLRYIHEKVVQTAMAIECLQEKQTEVYRVSHLKFDELNSELRQFYSRWTSVINGYNIVEPPWNRHVDFSRLLNHSTKSNTLIHLANGFCERLLFEYYDLPDVILPVYAVLQCFLLVFYLQAYICERTLKLRRIHAECNIDKDAVVYPSTEIFEDKLDIRIFALEGRESVMPMQFQFEVAQALLSRQRMTKEWNDNTALAFGWVFKEWGLWFEKHKEKKEQMFVYKSTGGKSNEDDDDETMPDPEDLEIQALLPNFDDTDFEAATPSISIQSRLPDAKQICDIVDLFVETKITHEPDTLLSTVWLLDFFNHSDGLLNANFGKNSQLCDFVENSILMDKHLMAVAGFRRTLHSKPLKNVINVYTENDKAEVTRCVDSIQKLDARVNEIRDEFPEEANLKDISEIISTFLNADCGVPQMKLASWLEKVLEKCEHWQKLAPRQYSLIGQLTELQEILVDWRKMQVHSWHHIIEAVKEDSQAIAVSMGYPIIDTLMQWKRNPLEQKNIPNYLAMIIDWIQSSTLIDFESRLKIASFAAALTEMFSKTDTEFYKLSVDLKSLVFYFSAYLSTVQDKLKNKRAEVIQELENFVNIVKFHDLNLWSVKNSAEKAHQKLFRIIKRYKLNGNEQLSSLFLSFLPEIPRLFPIQVLHRPNIDISNCSINFVNFFERFSNVLVKIPGLNESESLFDYCSEYLEIIKKDVTYAENDDEANEKLQGQALFDRQRRFAALIKRASKFGLRSRRAAPISSEELLKSSLTMDAKDTGLNEEHFRSAAVTRNMIIRLVNQLNAQKQPHILKQVNVQMISHIRGITEYGFSWLLNSVPYFQRLEETVQWIQVISDMLDVFIDNSERSPPLFTASGQLKFIYDEAELRINSAFESGKCLRQLIAAVPEKSMNSTYNPDVAVLSELRDVALHKEHSKYLELKTKVDNLFVNLENMVSICKDYGKKAVEKIWKVKDIENMSASLMKEVLEALEVAKDDTLFQHFPSNLNKLNLYLTELHDIVRREIRSDTPLLGDVHPISSDVFQLKLQQILKAVDSKIDENQAPLDIIKKITIACSSGIDFNQEISNLKVLMDQVSHGFTSSTEHLQRYKRLLTDILEIIKSAQSVLVQFTNWIASFYIHFGHVSSQILQKGLVNAIPKKEEGKSGQGKEMEDVGGENAGMGEGQGAKDVSDQIEETGQVEDLKNDDDEEKGPNDNQEPQEKPKDSENPLEMEDDFAADLENLDNDENEKGENDEDEPDEEPNVDWDMGDVEEPEENQLDPHLWDKPQQEDNKLDERPEGAENENDEMAAKENDDTVANKDDKKQDEENDGSEDDENKNDDEKEDDLENVNQNDVIDDIDQDESQQQQDTDELFDNNKSIEEDATDDEAEPEDGDEVDTNMETDENQEDATEEQEKDAENAEQGAESEEMEKNNQGQSASDEKTKKNSAMGENDNEKENNEEENDESIEAKEETSNGKNDAKNTRANASLKRAEKPMEESKDEAEADQEQESNRQHAQPTEEDDAMDVDRHAEQVDEAMEEDEIDEASKNLAHINDDKYDNRDQLFVQKSTLEEARSTRSQYERMKLNYDNMVDMEEQDEVINPDVAAKDEDFSLPPNEQNHTVIHISTDFFDLSQQAVKSLTTIQPDVDDSEALTNDAKKYSSLNDSVALMASELAENLRQILEPSIANRLQGDYRTGKRLNMRRLVSYIASDYRKNRIWLRRTKKLQRNFQIMVAIDDSQSMGENRMGEITCQSLCLIEKAFRQLEVGQLAICKFGQTVQMLREFTSATDAQDSLIPSLLDNLKFNQNKTDLLGLLSYASQKFDAAKENTSSSSIPVQMLVIIGDGHGAFAQGRDPLKAALKEMEHQGITVLYIIVDGKNSILKMNYTTFEGGKPKMTPYLSMFPFSFYALVRSISTLPGTLAESIRQWFEMAMQE